MDLETSNHDVQKKTYDLCGLSKKISLKSDYYWKKYLKLKKGHFFFDLTVQKHYSKILYQKYYSKILYSIELP